MASKPTTRTVTPIAKLTKSKKSRTSPKSTAGIAPETIKAQGISANSADRARMIEYAAYHIAEKDGFQNGKEQEYWLQAERQIEELFKGRGSETSADIH